MVSPTSYRMAEFRSAYGPKYQVRPNVAGFTPAQLFRLGTRTAAYGGAIGVAVMLFASGIPRVQKDVLQKVPVFGKLFIQEEVNPADSPF